ncbi:MAG: tetratricopeptide repeat protein [Planctomycetota bacterium]
MIPIPCPRFAAPFLLGALALGSDLQAQRGEAQVQADIQFARGLAARFQFVDLAEEVIGGLERERLSGELQEELALAKCEVYYVGAKKEGDKVKRLGLYEKSLGSFETFIAAHPRSESTAAAQRTYIDLCNAYASVMERALEEALGEEAEALRQKIRAVLEKGLKVVGDLIELYPSDPSIQQKSELNQLRLNKGQMLITLAKISQEGTFLFLQADKVLEALALDDETSGWAYNAYILLAKSKIAQAKFSESTAYSEYVIDRMIPVTAADRALLDWAAMPQDFKARRWELVERAAADLLMSCIATGDVGSATKWALHFHNSWKRDGFDLSPLGYLSLLEVGRTLLNSGGFIGGVEADADLQWFETEEAMRDAGFTARRNTRSAVELALQIAQQVNDANKGNILQVHAQKLISEIRDLPDVVLAPDVLFEAAKGEYNAKNFREACDALKGVARTLDAHDEATRRQYMPELLHFLGKAFEKLGRPLEAAMCYREAATTWEGSPDFDPLNARGYYSAMGEVKNAAKGDPLVNKRWLEAEALRVRMDSRDTDTIKWRQAEREYDQESWEAARAKYLEIAEGNQYYEQAVVKAALCLLKIGDVAKGVAELEQYVDVYVPDPLHRLQQEAKLAVRKMATAQAVYNLGRIASSDGRYERVVKLFAKFTTEYPDQTSYGPNAVWMLITARLALGQLEEAKADFAILLEKYPDHKATGTAALKLYEELKVLLAAAEKAGDTAQVLDVKRQMADLMCRSNASDASPSYQNLRTEATLWMDVQDWAKAEAAGRRSVQAAGKDPASQANIEKFALPDLGRCLLRLKRVQEAYDILSPLIPDPNDAAQWKVSASTTADWCRSVCGWVEGDAASVIEQPGVGTAADFEKASVLWLKLEKFEAQERKWECSWYEAEFELLYCWYRWGEVDSTKKEKCKEFVIGLRQQMDEQFTDVRTKCGNEVLQRRYLWLLGKVR